jgi:feruloyl esterase
VTGSLLYAFGTGYFGDLIYNKPNWDYRSLNIADGLAQADEKTGHAINADSPDLSAFQAAGGKLIQYHGWSDSAIPPASSIRYYEQVASKMGGVDNVKSFYRLFLAPGMEHCGFGPGPNAIGGVYGLPSPSRDANHNVVSALAHWVENGVAPDQIIATKYRDNDPSKGIEAEGAWRAYSGSKP